MTRLVATSLPLLLIAALATSPAAAETPRQLTGAEIGAVTTKSLAALRGCYEKHAARNKKATGRVEIDLIIHRDGSPFRIDVETPGVKSAKLSRCIGSVARSWRFPRRRGFTHTVVPFLFLRTHATGAGPAYSCWKSGGCPGDQRRPRRPQDPPSAREDSPRLSKKAD